MSYTDRKITQEEINAHHVQGATDYLIGNPQQNKAVFDNLPEFIAGKFNDLIDEIAGHHGDEIKVAVNEWLDEHPEATTTVQDNSLTTAKYVDGSVTEPKIAEGAVTPSKLDRAYTTPGDLTEVNNALTNEINVLDARMDEFASLPDGSTAGNAELLDIRVGANGETYQSAGGAVRGQVADLKSALANFNFSSVNFRIAQNTSHNYNADVCPISATSGDIIFVSIKTTDDSAIACQVFARKSDGTFAKLKDAATDGDTLKFTLSYDISGIGIYFGTQSSEKNISVLVNKESSFLFIPEELEEVETIARTGSCNFDPLLFKVGTLYSGTYSQYVYNRIAMYPSFFKLDYPVTISVDSGWKFGVHTFASASESAFVADSGWQTSNYTVPANTYFRIVVARETEVSDERATVDEWLSHISYDSEISQRISSIEAEVIDVPTYSYDGETIDFKKHGFDATRIGTVMAIPDGANYQQGFAIYNNVICQLYSDNKIILADYPSRSIIATLDIVSVHGDTMDFSNEFYNSNDEFPLAYITADTTPATVYVVRITRSATTLVRTLYFADISKTGYYAGHCIDPDTNILYMVGYLQNSYTDATNNKMIVSSWDLNNLTDNGDNTYIPEYIESFNVPFMKTVQGQKVFDNKLWLLSSPSGTFNTVIYVVDPYKRKVVTTMANFPTALKETECEDISFVLENGKYHMVISCYYYYRLDFN